MGKLFDALWDTRESLRKRGVGGTVRAARRRLFPPRVTPHPFDLTHGTDTGGLIPISKGAHPSAEHGRDYWGTSPSMLRGALAHWSATLHDGIGYATADYTFMDLGCGKGRALMIASELPFAAIIGVELDPALVAVGRKNLAIWSRTPHACEHLSVLNNDALAVKIPEMPVLLYLYNPFDAHVVGLLADRIAALLPSRRHPLDILYARPEHIEPFERLPGVQILWKGEVPFTPADTAADIFDTTQQQVFIYRLSPRLS
jgi:SAM-dependent methyltransferase